MNIKKINSKKLVKQLKVFATALLFLGTVTGVFIMLKAFGILPDNPNCDDFSSANFTCKNAINEQMQICKCYNLSNPEDVKIIYKKP